jgi:hypothetical protein
MLKRIVAITFVALLSLALAGTSIADTKKPPPENKEQLKALETFNKALQKAGEPRTGQQQGTGLKPSGTTSPGTVGRKIK